MCVYILNLVHDFNRAWLELMKCGGRDLDVFMHLHFPQMKMRMIHHEKYGSADKFDVHSVFSLWVSRNQIFFGFSKNTIRFCIGSSLFLFVFSKMHFVLLQFPTRIYRLYFSRSMYWAWAWNIIYNIWWLHRYLLLYILIFHQV